jgi:cell division protein FtsQ
VSRTGTTTRDRTGSRRRTSERHTSERHTSGRSTPERRPTTPVTPLARRRRPVRDPRRRRPAQAVAALLLLVTAGWLLWSGPVLAVGTIQVDGAGILPAEVVREAAGIQAGTPLLRIDVDAAETRVARLPQVASVEVTRGWPQSVVITVEERVPVAVVGPAGRRSLVDAEGVPFDTITGAPPPGVVPLDVAAPGPTDPATRAALEALVALPAEVRDKIAGATAAAPEDITLTLTDGTLVRWGGPAESGTKADVLTALLDKMAAGDLEPAGTIDVSAPDAVVLR